MTLTDAFKWAGFTGIGEVMTDPKQTQINLPIWGDRASGKSNSESPFQLSFGSKFLIATGLTIIGLYTVRRLLK